MTTRQHIVVVTTTIALLTTLVAVPGAVAAQQNSSVAEDILSDDGEGNGLLDAVVGFANGLDDRVLAFATGLSGDQPDASTLANGAQSAFNLHNDAFQSYANARTDASTDADVLKVTFVQGEDEVTRYVTADVNGSDYENVSMDTTTDRTVDEECTLRGSAARNADAEIKRFHDEFVSPDKNPTKQYLSEMGSKYGTVVGDEAVSCTFMEG